MTAFSRLIKYFHKHQLFLSCTSFIHFLGPSHTQTYSFLSLLSVFWRNLGTVIRVFQHDYISGRMENSIPHTNPNANPSLVHFSLVAEISMLLVATRRELTMSLKQRESVWFFSLFSFLSVLGIKRIGWKLNPSIFGVLNYLYCAHLEKPSLLKGEAEKEGLVWVFGKCKIP